MLSRQDIIDFCGLSEAQVRAIAKRERVSDISAASLGQSLLQSGNGTKEIERYIHDEMENAISCGRVDEGEDLQGVLAEFRDAHGCQEPGFENYT
jgi:hypothetical protein